MSGWVELHGRGLHSGKRCSVRLDARPGPLLFRMGQSEASLEQLELVRADQGVCLRPLHGGAEVDLCEHLLSALAGLNVRSGLTVSVPGPEVPLLDGGSRELARAIRMLPLRREPSRLRVTRTEVLVDGASRYTFEPGDAARVAVEVDFPGALGRASAEHGADDTEAIPTHQVTLSSFQIDKYEVTVGEYRKCVSSCACLTPLNSISPNCNYDKTGKDAHPVNCVEWTDAKKFCAWTGKRMPTEAEWEYAARGIDGRKYPWGNNAPNCSMADFKSDSGMFCSGTGTSPVGKHALGLSYWGAHDMGGNIEEWVFDFWGKYSANPLVNPSGPYSGTDHVTRGGNWEIESKYMRTYTRWHFGQAKYWIGFRCAKTGS